MAVETKTVILTIVSGHLVKVEGDGILTEAEIDEVKRHFEAMKLRLPKEN